MCGICGKAYFDHGREVDAELIKDMAGSMTHRGPDESGMYISGNMGLGHRRLNIIDLNTGRQPISNEDGKIWIVFNGEIYNYQELHKQLLAKGHIFRTHTDTEVILHLYEDLGEACLQKLRGMFAFAILDGKRKRLFLARDRIGIKPLYYTITRDALIFASEIKALLKDPSVEKGIDHDGLFSFLSYTFTPGPTTIFKGISKLAPGHYLMLEDGRVTTKQFWDILPYYSNETDVDEESLREQLKELLCESIQLHMISDVPVGFLLSGGVDSTAMLSLYKEVQSKGIKTFTIGFDGEGLEDERKYARIAAKHYNVEHYETTISSEEFFSFLPEYVWYMEEPVFEPPGISLYYVSKMAKEHVKVLISGEGGDEAFAGYQTYRNLVWIERIKKILGPAKSALAGLATETNGPSSINKIDKYAPIMNLPIEQYYYSRASSPANLFNRYWKQIYSTKHLYNLSLFSQDIPFNKYLKNVNIESDLKKMLYIDTKTWLPDRLLIKADKMTMANSIELRVPLLDHKVLEFAASLPDRQKLRGVTTKYIFKSILKNKIPNSILKKKKTGFLTPYAAWLQKNRDQVLSILLDKRTMQRGYFDFDVIHLKLIKPWEKDNRYSAEIFQLMVLELWHRIFLEDGNPHSVLPKFN